MLVIEELLSAVEAAVLYDAAQGLIYHDGKKTAGRIAREVKANDQAAPGPERDAILDKVQRSLMSNPVFASAARPKATTPLILSRYREGHAYGLHVDDAVMGGLRTDLSFTLFLSPPETYDGGALIVEDRLESKAIKLSAGDAVLYSSGTLHRVEPVSRGARIAVVGWVQSQIRNDEQRELLFDLDRAVQTVHAKEGKSDLLDVLTKTRSNLIRMWAEV